VMLSSAGVAMLLVLLDLDQIVEARLGITIATGFGS